MLTARIALRLPFRVQGPFPCTHVFKHLPFQVFVNSSQAHVSLCKTGAMHLFQRLYQAHVIDVLPWIPSISRGASVLRDKV